MNQKRQNNNFDQEEIDFRKYKLDEDSEFESRLEAKNIIKAFIQTENDAEEIKSRAQNKKPQFWKEQKDYKFLKNDGYNTKLEEDIELALKIINKKEEIPKKPTTDNVVLNMELRNAKVKQMKEDRIKQKQESEIFEIIHYIIIQEEFARFQAHKAARQPSDNRQSSIRASGSIQSSSQKGSFNDLDSSSQQSRPSTRYLPQQSVLNKQSYQSQSSQQINSLYNDSSITDLQNKTDLLNKKDHPKNEIQELKSKRQNLEMQSRKMEEDMKNLKENLRKELFQNADSSMTQNKNGSVNISETIDFLQKEADESRMKYNQFRFSKLVKAYNYVLKRYKRIYYNQVFDILKQKNREYQRHEQQCVNIMRLKKLFVLFSGWKKYMYSQKDEKDVKFYLQEKIHENTFLNRAGEYYKRRQIRICMRHWKKFWKISKQEKKLDEEKNDLKYKIKGFISNLKQNIQQSEQETQIQKEQQKQRVIEQFLKQNADQNIDESDEENSGIDDESQYNQKCKKQPANNNVKNQTKDVQSSNQPQSGKITSNKNAERNNQRPSNTQSGIVQSDYVPTKDNKQTQEKSPQLNKYNNQNKVQSNQVTPQKKQNNQINNKSPIYQQESPYPQKNQKNSDNKNQKQMMYGPQTQQSYSNSKSHGREEFGSQEDYDEQGQSYSNNQIDKQNQYYEQNSDDEDYYDPNDLEEIARSKVPQPQQSERNDQITFRQNPNQLKQQSSPNTKKEGRQDSKNHNQSIQSGKTNREQEREEKLKQIQLRTEDRKKKADEFKKKHEDLRKQKEEEKKRKEMEELEKEREKRKEEYDNFQKRKREEKEKKEKAEKDKQEFAEKLVLAKNHHQKSIIKYFGFRPWSKYMELQDHLIVIANQFNYMRLLKNGLKNLVEAVKISKNLFQQEMELKQNQAKNHYKKTILKKGFDLIRVYSEQSKVESEGYRQQRIDYLKRTVFYKWNDVLSVLRNENFAFEEQYKQIIIQFRKNINNNIQVVLQERAFRSWNICAKEEKAERIKNTQKQQYRSKVNQWLNEFKSTSNQEDTNQEQNSEQSDQLKNSTFDDINKSQVRNEALKKYYNMKNQLNKDSDSKDKKIYEQPQNNEDSEDEQKNYMKDDEQQNDDTFQEDKYSNKNKYNKYYQNDEEHSDEDDGGYKSLSSQQPNNLIFKPSNKNYDLPLIQVLQNTNELQQKLAKNNSKSSKNFNDE